MGELIARFKPGENVPGFAATLVRAGRFVKISGAKTAQGDYTIGECGAGERSFGVAERDSGPTTDPTSSWTRRVNLTRKSVARVVAGAAITAGQPVTSDAQGRAVSVALGVTANGIACSTVTAADQIVEVDLF